MYQIHIPENRFCHKWSKVLLPIEAGDLKGKLCCFMCNQNMTELEAAAQALA